VPLVMRASTGLIRLDPLGLDVVYVQAKRYTDRHVGRPDIQAFARALHGERLSVSVRWRPLMAIGMRRTLRVDKAADRLVPSSTRRLSASQYDAGHGYQ
jgi:Restriction endonuclease